MTDTTARTELVSERSRVLAERNALKSGFAAMVGRCPELSKAERTDLQERVDEIINDAFFCRIDDIQCEVTEIDNATVTYRMRADIADFRSRQ